MARLRNRLGAAVLGVVFSAISAQGAEVEPDLKRKINVAGKQRMLSQRMARAACFAAQGVMAGDEDRIRAGAQAAFAAALDDLRHGSDFRGMRAEQRPGVLAAMDAVEALWPDYAAMLDRAAADPEALSQVADHALPVLKAANGVVMALEAANAGSGVSDDLARLINVAGRQRMLTQRAAKEYCLIAAGIDVAGNRAALAKTVALFDRSLEGLIAGDAELGLIAAPDETLLYQLDYVRDLWGPLRSQFTRVIDGGRPGSIGMSTVAANIDTVLVAADEAVWFYENL